MTTPRIVLASTSRYRAGLLRRLLDDFEQIAPDVDERPLPGEAPAARAARLAAAKAAADLGSMPFLQGLVAALVASSHEEIIAYRAAWARQRWTAMSAALDAYLPGWTWAQPAGGLSVWARHPGDADSGGFAQAALRRGVALVPGRLLSVSGERSPWIRMAFTLTPDDLTTAVKTLATV